MFKFSLVAALTIFSSCALLGQDVRGTISGTITDPTGAAVPKVNVTAIQQETGTKTQAVSGDSGAYTLPFLAPGTYSITAEAAGFKQFMQQGLTLDPGAHPSIDIVMQLGSTNETVTVTADAPMITSTNASVGQVISTRQVEALPVNGRTPLMLDNLAMGVTSTFEPGPVRPFDNSAPTDVSMGGAPTGTNETMIDGAPDSGYGNALAYSPPQDAVAEVRVNAFESSAVYGHTGGGTLNQITKAGTNAFSGSLYEFNQTAFLDANQFFNNKAGLPRPGYNFNQYGLAVGGPVWIPKVYNGKNKVFWFFAFEKLKDADPANSALETGNPVNYATVPTVAERGGDLSALLKAGSSYQIFNPYSATQSGSTITRTPFAGNVIPPNLLNPVSQKILNYYPLPNLPGNLNGSNNYIVNATDTDTYANELGRLDFNISDKDKLFIDARHNNRVQFKNPYFPNIAQGNYLDRLNQGMTADNVYTFSPSLVLDVRANWTRYIQIQTNPSDGFNVANLGLPAELSTASQDPQFPVVNFSSCSVSSGAEASFQCLGYASDATLTYDSYQLFENLTKVWGNHTLQFGSDIRDYRWSAFTKGNSNGAFTFGNNWTNGPTTSATSPVLGQDLAAFLMGLPTSGSYDNNAASTIGSQYYSLYFQDDWRLRSNLTVNLGLRWEYETPATERYNRAVSGFNPTVTNPITAAAETAYATSYAAGAYATSAMAAAGITASTPAQFNAAGALTFASASNPDIYKTHSGYFSPRIGIAWTPSKLGSSTVIRGGFGIFVSPIELLDNAGTSTTVTLPQAGFSQTTQYVATNNNYLSPANTFSNPFPNGILPQNNTPGLGTFLGQGLTFFNSNVGNPYDIRWDLSIERQLPGQMVLELAYIGNHGVNLPITSLSNNLINTQLDYLPRQYLSTSNVRNNALNTALTATVANPFKGLLPNSTNLNGSTVQLQQLLAPFPQYPIGSATTNGIQEIGAGGGSSYYQSLDARLEKRLTNGLTFINNFIYESYITRDSYLNDSDPVPVKSVAVDSRPLREILAAVYNLPVGKGKALNLQSRWLNAMFGGWVLNGVMTFQSGPPLAWTSNLFYNGGALDFNAHQPNGTSFNTSLFTTASSAQPVFNIRTFNLYFNNLRRDPTKDLDLSILKNFYFKTDESRYFQLRFETYNTTNRVTFAAPTLNPTSSSFGVIGATANTPRRVQIGARLVF